MRFLRDGMGRTARGPFRATKFVRTLSMALSGITVRPSFSCGVTSTDSHLIGVCESQLGLIALGLGTRFGC